MHFERHIPHTPLSNHVESLWYFESDGTEPYLERMLPRTKLSLVINLTDQPMAMGNGTVSHPRTEYRTAMLCGVPRRYFIVDQQPHEAVIGVHFQPGGAHAFVEDPIGEFLGRMVELDAVWGAEVGSMRERILEVPTIAQRFAVLEAILAERLVRNRRSHPAVRYAIEAFSEAPDGHRIARTANAIGLSQRRFTALFQQEVGVTPKVYCRMQRFAAAVATLRTPVETPLVEVALNCGYFDQAHFVHDFRDLSGLTPGEFRRRDRKQTSHLLAD